MEKEGLRASWRSCYHDPPGYGLLRRRPEARVGVCRAREERFVERLAGFLVERLEDGRIDLSHGRSELPELSFAVRRQADLVPAAVGRVALSLDQATVLEVVEDADELAPIEPEDIGDRRLRVARALVQGCEDAVLVHAEAGLLELLEDARLDRIA